ncbi:hypothetical protein H4R99_004514 [Coemansia sp. RSA 1722]|nr:hypothetical protein IWW45_008486 [Coemansia sp. RSA 485]KAJ2597325.1 hypothetical protein GGF39_003096 [Coemansia sp. RSA 1721]KAJ2597421.1 hypothetical protein H4R99_004514 [Coemansia sp. RSA 1722]KAJ2636112.1 hypothetical protein GGF40_003202 [Coemansia sp. RSA 1286]
MYNTLLRVAKRASAVSSRRMYTTKPDVSFQELRQLIHGVSRTPYTLIDVREPHEAAEGKVPTATNIPLGDVAAAFSLPANEFKAKYGIDKPGSSQETIFYCRSGKRSQSAIDQVEKISPDLVIRNYRGSWLNYSENALDNKPLV